MDKFRRVRKGTTPPQQNPTATSSSAGASATTSSTKFTIEQKVTTGAVKKGPYSVKRSVDPNDVIIKRRLGEGSKPLFSRVDICVNRSVSPKNQVTARDSSSDSSSPGDRNRVVHRGNSSKSQVSKRKSVEKVPYYNDEKREKDRIKRIYGESRRSRSLSNERRRKMTHPRSRTRSPPSYRRHRSYNERRSSSRDRYRSRHRTEYSRSRSRSRERRRMSRNHHRNGSIDERQPPPPATQFIPIPVPVEYPYMQPTWGAPMLPPQPRFPFLMRPALQPTMPYMPRPHYRPPRYPPNAYQRGNFRPRQY